VRISNPVSEVPRQASSGSDNGEDEIYGTCSTNGDMRNEYKILVGREIAAWKTRMAEYY
jgi:hypothetical protein